MTDPAPLALPSRYVLDLRALAQHAHLDAAEQLPRLADELTHRLPPNVHRYELLARSQHTAALAVTVAAALEEACCAVPRIIAESVCGAYRATHYDTRRPAGDLVNRALLTAIGRVLDAVSAVQAEDDAEAEHEAEQERRIAEHERDLADRELGAHEARDWHPADECVADDTL
jgi:hypothetical protein